MKLCIITLLLLISFMATEMAEINSGTMNEAEGGEVDLANIGKYLKNQHYFVFNFYALPF